ncbi:hypothetical protein GCM10025867_18910 [Frondihabitans sucicola]|uniref:Uncharacterized protein n=2 Tax=Frondihabitans sucicola TaxID=1268041 RepID=A0ABN6Y187_9MICO|nr:hypothetical protein GCM10025867_18910 [Frondihabitans sucicola]
MYRNHTYGGGYFNFVSYIANLDGRKYADLGYFSANDSVSSVYNNGTKKAVRFYQTKNYTGPYVDLPLKTEDTNLNDASGQIKKVFNDRISSAKFI